MTPSLRIAFGLMEKASRALGKASSCSGDPSNGIRTTCIPLLPSRSINMYFPLGSTATPTSADFVRPEAGAGGYGHAIGVDYTGRAAALMRLLSTSAAVAPES